MPLNNAQRIQYGGGYVWSQGVREHWSRFGRSTAVHKFLCLWEDRLPILGKLAGGAGINTSNQFYYNASAYYPYGEFLFFDYMDVEGVPGAAGLVTQGSPQPVTGTQGPDTYISIFEQEQSIPIVGYEYAQCEVGYASLPYVEGQPGEWAIDFSMTELSLSNNSAASSSSSSLGGTLSIPVWKWNAGPDNGTVLDNSQFPSLPIPTVNLSYTLYNQPLIPFGQILSLIGLVNTSTVMIVSQVVQGVAPEFGLAAGCVMFAGGRSQRRTIPTGGNPTWDVTFNFQFNPYGWNNILDPTDGEFHQIVNAAGNTPFLFDGTGNAGGSKAPGNGSGYTLAQLVNNLV